MCHISDIYFSEDKVSDVIVFHKMLGSTEVHCYIGDDDGRCCRKMTAYEEPVHTALKKKKKVILFLR